MRGFVSYSHEDHELLVGFRPHLAAIRRSFNLELWTDHAIRAGTLWDPEISAAIALAHIFVLMITPSLIESDYALDKELPAIRQRRRDAGALVVPVVLKRCLWQYIASSLQAAPMADGRVRPVTDWRPREHGYDRAREEMMAAIEKHFGLARKQLDW
jgi:hypothetical protein